MAQDLSDFVQSVTGESHLRVEQDLGDGFVRLEVSEAERRQAIQDIRSTEDIVLELLRNSRDAHARNIFLAVTRNESTRTLVIIDDGCGIPASMHTLVFEPRVTSKLETSHVDKWGYHGRGMALFSIAQNAETAKVLSSAPEKGCAVEIATNLNKLQEKRDQSTFPQFSLGENGQVLVRGPKNIIRTACEFAIETHSECAVRVGSSTEIAAALYEYGSSTLNSVERAFTSDVASLPLVKQLATCASPEEFALLSASLGLSMSERSARRILEGEIEPAPELTSQIVIQGTEAEKQSTHTGNVSSASKDARPAVNRGLAAISAADKEEFAVGCKNAFSDLARKYYLVENVQPSVAVKQGMLVLSFPLIQKSD